MLSAGTSKLATSTIATDFATITRPRFKRHEHYALRTLTLLRNSPPSSIGTENSQVINGKYEGLSKPVDAVQHAQGAYRCRFPSVMNLSKTTIHTGAHSIVETRRRDPSDGGVHACTSVFTIV